MPTPALSVVERDGEACLGEGHGQGQAHVAQANACTELCRSDGDLGGVGLDFRKEIISHRVATNVLGIFSATNEYGFFCHEFH